MNEAMAKLRTLTRTTLTPTPAAERSLARTASIAEPSELLRSRATPSATTHEREQAQQPELDPGEVVAAPDAEIDAEQRRVGSPGRRRTSTIWVLRNHTASIA